MANSSKPQPGSLEAHLYRAAFEHQREVDALLREFCERYLYESAESLLKWLEGLDIETSDSAISRLWQKHGASFILRAAKDEAKAYAAEIGATGVDLDELTRELLQRKKFEASFARLSHDELVALLKVDLQERKLLLDTEKARQDAEKLELQKRELEAKLAGIKDLSQEKLSPEEYKRRVGEMLS